MGIGRVGSENQIYKLTQAASYLTIVGRCPLIVDRCPTFHLNIACINGLPN